MEHPILKLIVIAALAFAAFNAWAQTNGAGRTIGSGPVRSPDGGIHVRSPGTGQPLPASSAQPVPMTAPERGTGIVQPAPAVIVPVTPPPPASAVAPGTNPPINPAPVNPASPNTDVRPAIPAGNPAPPAAAPQGTNPAGSPAGIPASAQPAGGAGQAAPNGVPGTGAAPAASPARP